MKRWKYGGVTVCFSPAMRVQKMEVSVKLFHKVITLTVLWSKARFSSGEQKIACKMDYWANDFRENSRKRQNEYHNKAVFFKVYHMLCK